mmetsp:Transcript_17004/g.29427  ORF Transcript_17004/g.29427 Transcript_17004/m.29427 type:complete len:124 (-) Transcript_17004:870-1241(-)
MSSPAPAVGTPVYPPPAGYPQPAAAYPPAVYMPATVQQTYQPSAVLLVPSTRPSGPLDKCENCGNLMDYHYKVNFCGWIWIITFLFVFFPVMCLPCCMRQSLFNDKVYQCNRCGNMHVLTPAG